MNKEKAVIAVDDLNDLDVENVDTFIWGSHTVYKKDLTVKTFLEKAFHTTLKACYAHVIRPLEPNEKHGDLDWSGATLLLFYPDGQVTRMHNSEWATIDVME